MIDWLSNVEIKSKLVQRNSLFDRTLPPSFRMFQRFVFVETSCRKNVKQNVGDDPDTVFTTTRTTFGV